MTFSDLVSRECIVLINMKFTPMVSNSHKSKTKKSYARRRKEPPDPRKARVEGRHLSDSKRELKLRLSGACTVNHAHVVGVVRQPRSAS